VVLVPLLVKVLLLIVSNANVGAGCQLAVGACKAGLCNVLADAAYATCWLSALFLPMLSPYICRFLGILGAISSFCLRKKSFIVLRKFEFGSFNGH
jgi:hypothetical protein